MIKSGVYIITNLINKKVYIGKSINVYARLNDHKRSLLSGKHNNHHLQRSVDSYGIDNFTFELLEEYPIEYICSFENFWCLLLNTHNKDFGFNIKPTSPTGISNQSQETKDKIAISNTGRECLKSTKSKISNKLLLAYSEGRHPIANNIEHYKKVAAKNRGNKYSVGKKLNIKQLDSLLKGRLEKINKRVLQLSEEGTIIKEWYLTTDAADFYNVSYKAIWKAIKNNSKSVGFYWKYKQ
jgi:group I intron endonuclease